MKPISVLCYLKLILYCLLLCFFLGNKHNHNRTNYKCLVRCNDSRSSGCNSFMSVMNIKKLGNRTRENQINKLIDFFLKNQKEPPKAQMKCPKCPYKSTRLFNYNRPCDTSKNAKGPSRCRRWRAEVVASLATCVYNLCRQKMLSNAISRRRAVPRGQVNWLKVTPQP